MSSEWIGRDIAKSSMREPIFVAMDSLRLALDRSIELNEDKVASLLMIAIHDLADTIDIIDDRESQCQELDWSVARKAEF